jgi:hypothetical protein
MCGRYRGNVVSVASALKPAPIILAGHGVNRKPVYLIPHMESEEVVLRANQLPDNALRSFVDDWRR